MSIVDVAVNVVVALVSLLGGMAAAGAAQDRELLGKQKGVARALLADLKRIATEVEEGNHTQSAPYRSKPPRPVIHPWVEGLIPTAAESTPAVVERYMALQQLLGMIAGEWATIVMWRDNLFPARIELDRWKREHREEYERGPYNPLSDRHEPPDASHPYPGLPANPDPSVIETGAALELRSSLRQLSHAEEGLALSVSEASRLGSVAEIEALRGMLIPIASKATPKLLDMVLRSLIPIPEDAELDRIADRKSSERYVARKPTTPNQDMRD